MSGGVDSSTVAALLHEHGHQVTGFTLHFWRAPSSSPPVEGLDAISAAQAVCAHLGIPHHVVEAQDIFYRQVVAYFVAEYARGRTPNPCVRCNRLIKFGWLLDQIRALGCDRLATGHYARIVQEQGWQLLRGVDKHKDQSYFLYTLGQRELSKVLFPLGTWTKEQTRRWAAEHGLPVAERAESQDVCFLPDGDYRRFLRAQAPEAVRPGPIYDLKGRLLGEHQGLPFYTVGQREGLGISAPRPLYVLALDAERNALIVGYREALGGDALLADEMSYVAGHPPEPGTVVEAKIRYQARPTPARIWPGEDATARVLFERPLRDITPGQAVVLYQGDKVLGGGIIQRGYRLQADNPGPDQARSCPR